MAAAIRRWLDVGALRVSLMLLVLTVGCGASDGESLRDVVVVGPDGVHSRVQLPAKLDDLLPSRESRYQVHIDVELATALVGQRLLLVLPSLSARATAWGDTDLLVPVRGGATTGYRESPPLAWAVPSNLTSDGRLELVIEVNHTWTQSGWWTVLPELILVDGSLGGGTWVQRVNVALATACLVVLAAIGLLMGWMYFARRLQRASGWFAIQALSAIVYPAQSLGITIPLGRFEMPFMGTLVAVSATAALHYTHGFFSLPPPSRWWWRVGPLVVLGQWLTSDPFLSTYVGLPLIIAYLSVALCAILVTVVRLIATNTADAWPFLLAWLGVILTLPFDFTSWLGIAEPFGGARVGVGALVLFPFVLQLILNEQQVRSLDRANTQLAGQVRDLEAHRGEIELLNDELRRQISDRAGQIQAALLLSRESGRTAPVLTPGDIVQGRYRVERTLGSGGMGTVYEVTRLTDDRRLALKVAREVSGDAIVRMAREAQTAAAVTNPHVVAMLDVDVATGGFLFLVMELVDGEPLSTMRHRFGDRPWALEVLAQVAEGLAALHRGGVIHRDLKPANVLLAHDDAGALRVKITDFGISVLPAARHGSKEPQTEVAPSGDTTGGLPQTSVPPERVAPEHVVPDSNVTVVLPVFPSPAPGPQAVSGNSTSAETPAPRRSSASLTRTGHLTGTPAYMAPELVLGPDQLVPAADLFAFGVLAHQLLIGVQPFEEPPILALVDGRPPILRMSLEDSWTDAPAGLPRLLDACLDLRPSARPTAEEVASALRSGTHSPRAHT